jgi:hypothetical protein
MGNYKTSSPSPFLLQKNMSVNQRQRMTGTVVSLAHFLCPETRKRMAT